jgi:hypothetical protein
MAVISTNTKNHRWSARTGIPETLTSSTCRLMSSKNLIR